MREVTVEFVQGEQRWRARVPEGTSLLRAAHQCGAPVQTLCNGVGSCVLCKVKVSEAQWENLSAPESLERDRLGNLFHILRERMGCQARALQDVQVEVLDTRARRRRRFQRGPGGLGAKGID